MKQAALEEIFYWRPRILDEIRRGEHAIIEASAGTGKTFTIEHLLIDLLLTTPATIEQILIVTFTEKATAELRARIRGLIEELLHGSTEAAALANDEKVALDGEAVKRLERALSSFDRAPILTIHRFCQRVLTELAFLTGTGFDLEVVDAGRAFHQAFRAELREHLALDGPARALLDGWLKHQQGDIGTLEELLLKAHQRHYLEPDPAITRDQIARRFMALFDRTALAAEYGASGLKNKRLSNALEALEKLDKLAANAHGSSTKLFAALAAFDFDPLLRAKGVLLPNADATEVSRKPALSEFLCVATDLQLAARIEANSDDANETALVEAFLPAVAMRLDRQKRDQGHIDYEDMLLWVDRALTPPAGNALVNALRERFLYGLVDEFQDTDDLQWRIFRRIFVDGPSGANRLFVVGDPKQAIYAFRGADVHSYLKACSEMSAAGASRVALVTNFRSTAHLIDACNHIFDQTAESPFFTGEIRYPDPATCGRPARIAMDSRGRALKPVTLMRYEHRGASAADARAAIGRHIAATIGRLVAGKQSITVAEPDAKTGEPVARTVQARDVFVLTRTKRESEEIGEYLREAGVPFAFYKLEGLFQTREAHYVLDVLRAIEDPHDRSRRLRAWASPFFALPHRALATLGDVPTTHPLNERLYEWRALAESERFADLFNRLLHESGLVDRELFLADGERELTNYLHVFELLLEQAIAKRPSLAEIIALLEDYSAQRDKPPGPDGNVQRLESERAAVQVMTVHMSKGLEADVVVLYGGLYKYNRPDNLVIYHAGNERRFAIGKELRNLVKTELHREEAEENQRLLYVAMTRARVKLYLPLLPDGSISTLTGPYKHLNDRLKQLAASLKERTQRKETLSALFEIDDVPDSVEAAASTAVARPLIEWSPPQALLKDNHEPEAAFVALKRAHAPTFMSSYTSLKQAANATASSDITPEDFKVDLEPTGGAADLPGGANVGIFLHEVIERLNLESFEQSANLETWKNRDDVKELFRETMRRNQVRQPRWFDRGCEIVFNALTTRFTVPRVGVIGPLHACPSVREMEFVYPIRETAAQSAPGLAVPERGFLKGFVDFVFEQDGLVYFADWKSDLLASYDSHAIEEHVRRNYELQARIYTTGIIRMLRVRDEGEYERRFGGLLYVFLRGLHGEGAGTEGIYFHRPRWAEIRQSEGELMKLQGVH